MLPFCSMLSSTIWYKSTNVYGWFEESLSLGNNSFVRENRGLLWTSLLLSKTFDTGRQLAGLLRRTLGTLSGWAWLPARNRYHSLYEERKRWIKFYGKSYTNTRIQGNLFFQNLTWEYIHLPSPGHFTNPTGVVATVSDIDVRFPYWWRHKNSSVGLLDVSGNLELSVVNITTSVLPGKVTAIQWTVLTGQVYSVLRGHPVPVYLWTFFQCHCQRQSNHSNFQKYKGIWVYQYNRVL